MADNTAKEVLIESGASRLSWKIVQLKAQAARNSKAIVKVCNTEMDDFTPQDAVSRFNQRFPKQQNALALWQAYRETPYFINLASI